MFKKIAIVIGLSLSVLVILFLAIPTFLGVVSRDIQAFDESDLELQRIVILEEENAYYDIVKLESISSEQRERVRKHVKDEEWDESFVQQILAQNSESIEHFTRAAERAKFQDPAVDSPEKINPTTVFVSLSALRDAANLSSLKAESLFREGSEPEAFEEALRGAEISQKVYESQGSLIHYLTATAIKIIALERLHELVQRSTLSPEEVTPYIDRLERYKVSEDGFKTAFKGEFHTASWSVDFIASGKNEYLPVDEDFEEYTNVGRSVNNSFYFKPNKTRLLFAGYARQQIENTEKPCRLINNTDPPLLLMLEPRWKWYFTENVIGKLLHDIVAVSLEGVHKARCDEKLIVSVNQTLMAIKAYKNEQGDYPVLLSDLVPQYLARVPEDPFDGQPLRYSKNRKIIYSVGASMEDPGGSEGEYWREMDDPTFPIKF